MGLAKEPTARFIVGDLLVELQTQDIPARFCQATIEYLKFEIADFLLKNAIPNSSLEVWMTPRRTALMIRALSVVVPSKKELVMGPKVKTLYDSQGQLLPGIAGFSRAKNVDPKQLFLSDTPKGSCVSFYQIVPAKKTLDILNAGLKQIVLSIPFPKTMRWETSGLRFARPVDCMVALYERSLLRQWRWFPGVSVSKKTMVGRRLVVLERSTSYGRKLSRRGLILDFQKRQDRVTKAIAKLLPGFEPASLDLESLYKEALLLVERPLAICGSFDPAYGALPAKVILAILAKSKVFGVRSKHSTTDVVEPKFMAIIEQPANNNRRVLRQIAAGYARLAAAKLFDARFFWEQDQKKPLSNYREKLKGIVWSKELGSLWDKVTRVRQACDCLGKNLGFSQSDLEALCRGADLYKADLATSLVGEYPELAGSIGSYYARNSKETELTVRIIEEAHWDGHWDQASKPGSILALADRLDTLLAQFSIGQIPSAKEDPLGLKRVCDEAVDILWVHEIPLSLDLLLDLFWRVFPGSFRDGRQELVNYLENRLILFLQNKGFRSDIIAAVIKSPRCESLTVPSIKQCLLAYQQLKDGDHQTIEQLAQSFKRINNILRQAQKMGVSFEKTSLNPSVFDHDAERGLWRHYERLESDLIAAIQHKNYRQAFELLATLAQPLALFFDEVMVLADDEKLKMNRLSLLLSLQKLVLQVLDPSQLLIERSPKNLE